MSMTLKFPLKLPANALALKRSAVAISIELPSIEPELWVQLTSDGRDETGPAVGYLLLRKKISLNPGLSLYAVEAVRPPHDPPPNPAAFRTVFPPPSLATHVSPSTT